MWVPPYGPPHHGSSGEPPLGCPLRAFENPPLALITHCPIASLLLVLIQHTCIHRCTHIICHPSASTPPPPSPALLYLWFYIFPAHSLCLWLGGLINLMEISSSQGWPPLFVIWFGDDKSESGVLVRWGNSVISVSSRPSPYTSQHSGDAWGLSIFPTCPANWYPRKLTSINNRIPPMLLWRQAGALKENLQRCLSESLL